MTRAIAAVLFVLCFPGCGLGEPAVGSPDYFERVLGLPASVAGPEYRCRRESVPDISFVAAFQLPDSVVERLRRDPDLLKHRPEQLEFQREHTLVRWSQSLPSGEVAAAVKLALSEVSYVEGGDCVGSYVAARVLSELPTIGSSSTFYSVQYKRFGPAPYIIDSVDLLLLDLQNGRFYLLISDT